MSSSSSPLHSEGGEDIITVEGLSKSYTLYPTPMQRLVHALIPLRSYPRFDALTDVSFRVRRGETIGIIGQNGAGKSTLLQIITGTVRPSAGRVSVKGRIAALLELGAGFEPDFTGRENIRLNGAVLGLSQDQIADRMDRIIDFSELAEFIDRPVRTYSSGMFMRLAFSVAAHVDADTLIIDEALAVGDARFTQKCMRFLKDFKQRGSILFVSHDLGAVAGLCDRVLWLDRGRVRGAGAAIEMCEQYVASLFERPAALEAPPIPPPGAVLPVANSADVLLDDIRVPPESQPGVTSCSLFNPDASSFGVGGAMIIDAGLYDPITGSRLSQVGEGQDVDLAITARAEVDVTRPIFGFYVKDRLGQLLLGDNTFWEAVSQHSIPAGTRATARFRFRWPALMRGAYTLTVALADGIMANHIQRHWMHDAVVFEVLSSSARLAMVGVRLSRVSIERNG